MSEISTADVVALLGDLQDPETGRKLKHTEQLGEVATGDGSINATIKLTTHCAPLWDETREHAEKLLREKFPDARMVNVHVEEHHRPAEKLGQIGITAKSVIAVGSGKGGVGKSTIAASLALGLQRAGCKVGLMDADVYGPSIPHLLGVEGRPEIVENRIQPIVKNGLPVMSIGFLVPKNDAVIWRGPMLHQTVTQFLRDVNWGDLDYLVIDMPPGTGDVALTLSQLLPVTGAVVVCTPQHVALLDAVKTIAMFGKVNIPVAGTVENMSGFVCPDCDKRYDIFGSGGAKRTAEELKIPFLGDVPLHMSIRAEGDAGDAGAVFDDEATRPYFEKICYQLVKNISQQAQDAPPLPSLNVL